jgi:hypothetical protein
MKPDIANLKILALTTFLLVVTGCATLNDQKPPEFDPGQIKAMTFRFHGNNGLFGNALETTEIVDRVINNLAEWGYPFTGAESNEYSHDLVLNINSIIHGSTPVGFSFTSGNSDPRALDFQKADVLPLTCTLMPKGQTELRAELTLEVLAKDYSQHQKDDTKLIDSLINDASTACFNLLRSLSVKTVSEESPGQSLTPSWIPEIQVEYDIDKEMELSSGDNKTPADNKTVTKPSPRKRIVIHNQGNPVIFKFGHERK